MMMMDNYDSISSAMDGEVLDYYKEYVADDEEIADESRMPNIQVRIFGLEERSNMRELNPTDIDTLVAVKGMVIRVPPVSPDLLSGTFSCTLCQYQLDAVVSFMLVLQRKARIQEWY